MSLKLTVLYPDGHRRVFPVTPNTSLFQVLEEACKNKGLSVDDYSLKHYKTVLSPGQTVRFANLPNNALLELVESETKSISNTSVTICLQTEDGSRRTQDFPSSETLWGVMVAFDSASPGSVLKPESSGLVPVCVYANAEIVGRDALESTLLRTAGLISGRHMIRLLHRSPTDIGVQARAPPGSVVTHPSAAAKAGAVGGSQHVTQQNKPIQPKAESHATAPPKPQRMNKAEPEKPKQVKKEPPPAEIKLNVKDFRGSGSSADAKPQAKTSTAGRMRDKTPPRLYRPAPEAKGETVFLDDEGTLAFHVDSSVHAFPKVELPEEFFQHTVQDVKYLYKALKTQREAMEEAPLLTSEQRKERERQRKLASCGGVCILRIQFPDRIVLQSLFCPDDTIKSVRNRARKFLRDPTTDFYLYFTPPRRVLGDNETLLESGCCPTSVLFFGVSDDRASGTSGGKGPNDSFLNDKVMGSLSTAAGAISWAKKKRTGVSVQDEKGAFADYLSSHSVTDTVADPNAGVGAASGVPQRTDRSPSPAPVPKWFKMRK